MLGIPCQVWVLSVLTALSSAQLVLIVDGDNATITYQGKEILHHTPDSPILAVGYGVATFKENHGNFDITDSVEKKVELTNVFMGYSDNSTVYLTIVDPTLTLQSTIMVEEITGESEAYSELIISTSLGYPEGGEFNRLWIRFTAEDDEKIYGGGEQYSYLNLRGRDYPIWTREQGVGRDRSVIGEVTNLFGDAGGDYHTTYWPQGSFLSSRHYALFTNQLEYMVLNFTEEDRHEIYLHSGTFSATMLWSSTMIQVVQTLSTKIGLQPMLPDWLMTGATLGVQRGTEEMLYYYDLAKSFGVNISAVWIQDWSGYTETLMGHRVYWNWRWNKTYYPDLDKAIDDLKEEGVKVMVYMNPHLILGSDMFEEADASGFLMKNISGHSYLQDFGGFQAGTIDLAYKEARLWYRDEIVKNIIDLGIGGWMADFGEYTRTDMVSSSIYAEETLHSVFPVEWARCNREALEISNKVGDVVPFMRSGGLGSSRHQVLAWAGDQNVDWAYGDGLPSTIVAALNLGLSGMGFTHFDIGGYTTEPPVLMRSKELFLRSAEYAVFTPVMRTHEGNIPEANHQFYSDNDTLTQFARLTQMHSRLLPYLSEVVKECSEIGTPVQRPLFLHYEGDAESWNITYQYLLGRDLLVAPVLHKKVEKQLVYIPGGDRWIHMWEGLKLDGPHYVSVDAPLGYPPVFYRNGSLWEDLFQDIGQEFGPDE